MASSRDVLAGFLDDSHLLVPDAIPPLLSEYATRAGARSAVMQLVDLDQRMLLPVTDVEASDPVAVDGTPAGESYRKVTIVERTDADGHTVWVPLVDGTERLGVVEYRFATPDEPDADLLWTLSSLTAEMVMSKRRYGDALEIARRRAELTVTAELLWQLLPPLTFATDDLVITGFLVPTHDVGGDAYDYGVDRHLARFGIFDAMGHGLNAGLMATTAVAAFRNARRRLLDDEATARHIGDTIADTFGDHGFVTGLVASLDHRSGDLQWCSAGHPPPIVVRQGQPAEGQAVGGMPFGVGAPSEPFHVRLEPGDRVVLYSDGIIEGRAADGAPYGAERLIELVARIAEEEACPEAVRRVMHKVEEYNFGSMRDDATLLMVEWKGAGAEQLTP
jgi:hypothetical protein